VLAHLYRKFPIVSLLDENLLSLREAAQRIPGRVPGKPINVSQLHRWTSRGLNGVVLETVRLGQKLTSIEALERFAAEVSRRRTGATPSHDHVSPPTRRQWISAAQKAGEELDRLL
jgi:hypothetical protein